MKNSVALATKICSHCDKEYVPTSVKQLYCPVCRKVNRYAIYGRSKWNTSEAGRIYMQQYSKNLVEKLKSKVFDYYGSLCNCCGEDVKQFLTIDHVLGGGSKERREHYMHGTKLYKKIIAEDFPEDYQVLCMNCNFGKKITGGLCPHQL